MKRIIGSKFHSIYRVVDMLCLNLGSDVPRNDGKTIPEYSFHIQTQWRFVKAERIIVASRDVYIPNNPEMDDAEWVYDLVGRPDDESSVFDVVAKSLPDKLREASVTQTHVTVFGDLKIAFSNGIIFETFTPSVRKEEEWRFLNAYDSRQFVVFDD